MVEVSVAYQIISGSTACKSLIVGFGGVQNDCIGSTVGGKGSTKFTVVGKRLLTQSFSVCCTQ